MLTEAETRRRKKQDATRKRVAIWLKPEVAATLDALRGDMHRTDYIAGLIARDAKRRPFGA